MSTRKHAWGLPLFCLKFVVILVVLEAGWLLLLPYYGNALVQVAGVPLRYGLGVPIEAGRIEADGILNWETRMIFTIDKHERAMPIAELAANVPPYIALVLATAGLTWKRRGRILAYGLGILCAFHVLFIIVALRFQDALMQVSEIPVAVIQFFITLPFMLWIVFAYWDRLLSLGLDKPASPPDKTPPPAQD